MYVAWFSAKLSYSSPGGIYVASSTDNGQTWGAPADIYPLSTNGEAEIVATTGSDVYVMIDRIQLCLQSQRWNDLVERRLYELYTNQWIREFAREPWVVVGADLVYATWEANATNGAGYQDYGVVSTDGGVTWGRVQTISGSVKDSWTGERCVWKQRFHDLPLSRRSGRVHDVCDRRNHGKSNVGGAQWKY